jgi:hypothetical protein
MLWIVKQACKDYLVEYADIRYWETRRTLTTVVNAQPGSCPENNDKALFCRHIQQLEKNAPGTLPCYVLPEDTDDLTAELEGNPDSAYVVKIRTGSSGRGISVVRGHELLDQVEELSQEEGGVVVQRYVVDPFLVDGRKTDLRVYALVFFDPLVVYVYPDGYVNVAQREYSTDTLDDPFAHIANYGVALPGTSAAERRGRRHTIQQFRTRWPDGIASFDRVWKEVEQGVALNVGAYARSMGCRSPYGGRCGRSFQYLGLDVVLEKNLATSTYHPRILEVNNDPGVLQYLDLQNVTDETSNEWHRLQLFKGLYPNILKMVGFDHGSGTFRQYRSLVERDLHRGNFNRAFPTTDRDFNERIQRVLRGSPGHVGEDEVRESFVEAADGNGPLARRQYLGMPVVARESRPVGKGERRKQRHVVYLSPPGDDLIVSLTSLLDVSPPNASLEVHLAVMDEDYDELHAMVLGPTSLLRAVHPQWLDNIRLVGLHSALYNTWPTDEAKDPVSRTIYPSNFMRFYLPYAINVPKFMYVDADTLFQCYPGELLAKYPRDGKVWSGARVAKALRGAWMKLDKPSFVKWATLHGLDAAAIRKEWLLDDSAVMPIINGGVYVVDTEAWREVRMTERMEKIVWYNINLPLNDRFMRLGTQYPFFLASYPGMADAFTVQDLTWNTYSDHYTGRRVPMKWRITDTSAACLLHFTGAVKPWTSDKDYVPFKAWKAVANRVLVSTAP